MKNVTHIDNFSEIVVIGDYPLSQQAAIRDASLIYVNNNVKFPSDSGMSLCQNWETEAATHRKTGFWESTLTKRAWFRGGNKEEVLKDIERIAAGLMRRPAWITEFERCHPRVEIVLL